MQISVHHSLVNTFLLQLNNNNKALSHYVGPATWIIQRRCALTQTINRVTYGQRPNISTISFYIHSHEI